MSVECVCVGILCVSRIVDYDKLQRFGVDSPEAQIIWWM